MNKQGEKPKVSIIIPSWTGDVKRLMSTIERQTFRDYEINVVSGVTPASRARNIGASRTTADILLFVDDDAYFGNEHVLHTLIELIESNPEIAVAGTSKLVPREASRLQKAIARQVPRMVYPVVTRHIESNPPLDSYGFTAVTTTCCAVRRDVFEAVGGFDEDLTTGPEDTDFFYRVHQKGYKIVVAKDTWVYHDPPASLRDLLRKSFWYGVGHALEARKSPQRRMNVLPLDRWYGKLALVGALPAFPFALFIHYYFDPVRRVELGFRPLKTLSTYAVLTGYAYGWFRGKPLKVATTYMGRKGAGSEKGPRNVLYVDAYPKIGGGQRVLHDMATKLNPQLYRPVVGLPPANPLQDKLGRDGVRTVTIPFRESNYTLPNVLKPLTVLDSFFNVVRVIGNLISLGRSEKIDIMHANSAIAGVHALPAAMWLGIPCVVHAHDFNTAPFTNFFLKQMMRYPRSALIFVARVLAEHYGVNNKTNYLHRVIYNGVQTDVYRPDPNARGEFLRELGIPQECFVIGAVGRLERWKGFDVLLNAFALVSQKHPQARLVMVGDVVFDRLKNVKEELRETVRDLGLEGKVIFTGFRSDIPHVMAAIDLLAHSPVQREGFPMTLLEAMACARPIVTVPAGGTVEQVFNGRNGFLVPAGDIEALAAAISQLIANPDLARRYGETGRRMVEEQFNVDLMVSEVQSLYDRLLGANAPAAPRHSTPTAEVESPLGT
jgi:glycosyltransferase involved in cell wall biosynthesis